MKNIIVMLCAVLMSACGAASSASKVDTFDVNVSANLPVFSGSNVWTMRKEQSTLDFVAVHNSREFTGAFKNFAVAIQLDPSAPEGGKIEAVIDLSSVDAGDRDRNANLPTSDWFHVARFPLATFSSSNISALGGDNFKADGELEIKGISKSVALVFSLQIDGNEAVAIGGANLDRRDFKVGEGPDFEGEDWVKFPVEVKFNIAASN